MTEGNFSSAQLVPGLRNHGVIVDRIENTAGVGICDITAIWNKREIWIETKIVHGKRVSFRTFQGVWITRRVSAGSSIFVVAKKDNEIYAWWAIDLLVLPRSVSTDRKWFTVDVTAVEPIVTLKKPVFQWQRLRDALFHFSTKPDFSDLS
jgi:hypothetical protein